MAEDSEDSSNSQDSSKASRSRSRIGPKKAARIAAGEDLRKGGKKEGAKDGQLGGKKASQKEFSSKGGSAQKRGQTGKSEANAQGMASRKLALETLIKIEKDGAYANLALSAGFERQQLSEKDRAFVTALVQGVLRNQNLLDQKIQTVSKEPLGKMPPLLRNLLRMAIFQLENFSETPQHAILDTSNKLARALGHEGLVRYTNGVLRGYLRRIEKNTEETVANDAQSLSIKYSLPVWLIEKWIDFYGPKEAQALLDWSQREPGLTVRVSDVNVEPKTMLDIMNKNGFAAREGDLVPSCLIFEGKEGGKSFSGSPQKLLSLIHI